MKLIPTSIFFLKQQNKCFTNKYFKLPHKIEDKIITNDIHYTENGSFLSSRGFYQHSITAVLAAIPQLLPCSGAAPATLLVLLPEAHVEDEGDDERVAVVEHEDGESTEVLFHCWPPAPGTSGPRGQSHCQS
jgi:hypothetical protein